MADERDSGSTASAGGDVTSRRSGSGTDITGGTDKNDQGGLAGADAPSTGDTGVKETGDILGASSTHAGAGGQMGNTGGTGTAPTGGGDLS